MVYGAQESTAAWHVAAVARSVLHATKCTARRCFADKVFKPWPSPRRLTVEGAGGTSVESLGPYAPAIWCSQGCGVLGNT